MVNIWTKEEIEILKQNRSIIPYIDLLKLLPNKNIDQICSKASRLKLKRYIQPPLERFEKFVNKNSDIFGEDGKYPTECHIFNGFKDDDGYGSFRTNKKSVKAHRWIYEYYNGKVPNKYTIDHLCRIRNCVNPEHLEPATNIENVLRGNSLWAQNKRKTHCKYNHPLDKIVYKKGKFRQRECSTCRKQYWQKYYNKNKNKLNKRK